MEKGIVKDKGCYTKTDMPILLHSHKRTQELCAQNPLKSPCTMLNMNTCKEKKTPNILQTLSLSLSLSLSCIKRCNLAAGN